MSEQQRVVAAVALCLAIFLGWQYMTPKPPPAKPKAAVSTPTEIAKADAVTTPTATTAEAGGAPVATPVVVPEEKRSFSTPLFDGELSNVKASLTVLHLKNYLEREEGKAPRLPVSLVTAEVDGAPRQALVTFDLGGKAQAPAMTFEPGGTALTLRGTNAVGVTTQVEVTPRQDVYALDYLLTVTNSGAEPMPVGAAMTLTLKPTLKGSSGFFAPPADMLNGLCGHNGKVERNVAATLVKDGAFKTTEKVAWVGIDRQYFVTAVLPAEPAATASCELSAKEFIRQKNGKDEKEELLTVTYAVAPESLAPSATWQKRFTVYLGPKRSESLAAVSPALTDTIDYVIMKIPMGAIARPMVYLLNLFHGWTLSWGLAIMMLTLLVKLLLFPVTLKSSLSMRKMQLLKPELDKLKKLYEKDRERQQLEQMKLFREKGVNPLGGCLPMLLQMPIWFALYRTLWSAVDLYQQQFLWIPDLTAKEPLPFMAVGIALLTFLQQKLTPTTMDSQQAKMMLYMMPAMMLFFMIALPSGLVLYILVNAILTIFQQVAINRTKVSL